MEWHKQTGKNKRDENITLCGSQGAATNIRNLITCNKCRVKLHMKKISEAYYSKEIYKAYEGN